MGARYGQHFLRDPRVIAAILDRFAPSPDDRVVEIGPGRGALTAPLASRAAAFAAVEIDLVLARELAAALGMRLVRPAATGFVPVDDGPGEAAAAWTAREHLGRMPGLSRSLRVGRSRASERERLRAVPGREEGPREDGAQREPETVRRAGSRFAVHADALTVAYGDLAHLLGASEGQRLRILGNLPYGVATALVQRMIAARDRISDAMIMVQKEVADRLLAHPGGKDYGFLSVVLGLTSERARVLTLGPGAFSPAPKVRSSVVSLRFPLPPSGFPGRDAALASIVKIAFAERRKRAASNLARGLAIARAGVERTMEECGVDPGVRAERIDPEAFARLADRLAAFAPRPRGA